MSTLCFDFLSPFIYTFCHIYMSPEARERTVNDGFKSIEQSRFPCSMELNERVIRRIFESGGLDYHGVTIEPMFQSDVEKSRHQQNRQLFTTEKVDNRWRIQVNDEAMMAKSRRKWFRKTHQESFAQELNGVIKSAVLECVKKEWRLEMEAEEFSFLPLIVLQLYHIAISNYILHLGDGKTLVREKS